MNNRRLSPKIKAVIARSRDEAIRLGHDYIGTEHLLLGIIAEKKGITMRVLESLDVNPGELKKSVEDAVLHHSNSMATINVGNIPLNRAS